MDTLFRVEMLGRFAVWQGSREISRFRTQKTASLLACLALFREQSHPRDVLIERFWPDSELKAARSNLSVALNALRGQLEPPGIAAGTVLITDHARVRLNPRAFITDVEEFHAGLREAAMATDAESRLTRSIAALERYQGDLLPGYYEDWVLTERERLQDVYRTGLRQTVQGCIALKEIERGIAYARRLVQADTLSEEAHCLLIRLLIDAGRPQDALRQYQELERILQDELLTSPSAAARELVAPLRAIPIAPRPAPTVAETPAPEKPVPVAEPATERPLPGYRLPHQFTRFFGREEELARLAETLRPASESPARLITLTGAGGTGKTRIAVETAWRLKDRFPGGVWFVPLADVTDPNRLGDTVRDTLELPRQTKRPALEQVIAFLGSREGACLLALDNLEQIAAGGGSAVWTLLQRVPALWCLVTSRRALGLPGEREIPLAPLPVPDAIGEDGDPTDPESLLTCPSVALFVDRSQAARSEFQITTRNARTIATLCQRLEGIPLAIELAAARARALTPAQMLERLTERFDLLASRRADKGERHRSLWAAIDWSYHLLSPDLQSLFARLSVFRGGWTLEAAEAVAGGMDAGSSRAEPDGPDRDWGLPRRTPDLRILDAIALLRSHSLIQADESSTAIRFRMLESLREFAEEQVTPEDRQTVARMHAAYFHGWVTGADIASIEQTLWFSRFEEDRDNLRGALDCLRSADAARYLELATGLGRFWRVRGYGAEGRERLEAGLEMPGIPEGLRAKALDGAGILAYRQGDTEAARKYHQESLEIARRLGDQSSVASALNNLGNIACDQGDYAAARLRYEEGLALQRDIQDPWATAVSLHNLARVARMECDYPLADRLSTESLEIRLEIGDTVGAAYSLHSLGISADNQGDFETARVYYEQSLEKYRETGERLGLAGAYSDLGDLARFQGDFAAARALYNESRVILHEIGEAWQLGVLLNNLGLLEKAQGNADAARAYYEQSLALKRQIGDRRGIGYSLHYLGQLAFASGDYETARTLYHESLTLRREMSGYSGVLDSLDAFSELAAVDADWDRAIRLFAAVDTLHRSIGESLSPEGQARWEERAADLRARVSADAFAASWGAGAALTWDEAMDFALSGVNNATPRPNPGH